MLRNAFARNSLRRSSRLIPARIQKSKFSTAPTPSSSQQENSALTTITFQQTAKTGISLTIYAGVAAAVAFSGYLIFQELNPWKLSPNGVFDDAFEFVRNHSEVTARLGTPVKGYGQDLGSSREGRRNFVQHDSYVDDDGVKRIRIKFNLEGPNGKAIVYAEKSANDGPRDFAYVILDHQQRGRRETVGLVDNRKVLTREELQDKITKRLAKAGITLYGHTSCQWTKRQREELGEFADRIRTVYCDKKENEDECLKANLKGYPTWRFKDQNVPGGFQTLEQLQSLARVL